MLLVSSLNAVAARESDRLADANERAFQEAVQARTGFPIFDETITNLKQIRRFLKRPISLEIKSNALARAAAHGDVELLQLLISHGADVNYVG